MNAQACLDFPTAARQLGHSSPSVLMKEAGGEAFLAIERHIILKIPVVDTVLFLLSAFYVFNMVYPKGLCGLYQLMEKLVLDKHSSKTPQLVTRLYTTITTLVD